MSDSPQPAVRRAPSLGLQLLGLVMMLAGIGIIFAGELDVLPRGVLTSALGGGVMGGGLVVLARGRITKA